MYIYIYTTINALWAKCQEMLILGKIQLRLILMQIKVTKVIIYVKIALYRVFDLLDSHSFNFSP